MMTINYTNYHCHHLSCHPCYGKLSPAELLNTKKVCRDQVAVSGYFNGMARGGSARQDCCCCLGFFVAWVLFKLWGVGMLYRGIWRNSGGNKNIWLDIRVPIYIYIKNTYAHLCLQVLQLLAMTRYLNSDIAGQNEMNAWSSWHTS